MILYVYMTAKEQGRKFFFRSRWFVLFTAIAAFLVVLGFARAYHQDYLVTQDIERLRAQAKSLAVKKIELLEVLKYVKSDSFVEERARLELNMAKPGENVLVVPPTEVTDNRKAKNNVVGLNNISNYKKWWQYFTN